MAGREYNYIRGNNAIAPKRKYRTIEEEKRVHKEKVAKRPKVKTYKLKKIKGVVGISWLIFIIGGLTVGSYGNLYTVQKSLGDVKNEIKSIQADNEALRVDLLKFYSIHGIKEVAADNEMFLPAKSETIDVKWSKDYFENIQK